MIVRKEGGDVFTKDAFEVVSQINSVLASEALSDNLSFAPGRGATFSYLDPAIAMAARTGASVAADQDVKDLYPGGNGGVGSEPAVRRVDQPERRTRRRPKLRQAWCWFSRKCRLGRMKRISMQP